VKSRRLAPYASIRLSSASLFLRPSSAGAGAFYVPDIGTRGLARAGAFIASPDSLLAMHYNPAGLALLSGLHFEVDGTLSDANLTFARSCPCVDPSIPGAADIDKTLQAGFQNHPANTNTPLMIPFIGIAYGFPFMNLTVGFAAYGPNAARFNYSNALDPTKSSFNTAAAANPERYAALNSELFEANYQLAAAFQPLSGLRLGGSLMLFQNGNTQSLHLWLNSATLASTPEATEFDVPITFSFKSAPLLNWSIGASYDVLPGLTVGGSFRGKRSVRAEGTVDLRLPGFLTQPPVSGSVTGRDIEIELNSPPIGRLGVQYSLPHLFKVEGAFVYEWWSTWDRVLIRPKDITVSVAGMSTMLPRLIQPRGWTNTYSLRLGAELNLLEPVVGLRAGYFFEPTAIPGDRLDNSTIDLNKHGIAIGASTTLFGFTLEVAGMYVALESLDEKASTVKNIGPLLPPLGAPTYITTVGNGSYSGNYWFGSVSLAFALDPLLGL
jgi:long-chain fatty acid transport protein